MGLFLVKKGKNSGNYIYIYIHDYAHSFSGKDNPSRYAGYE